MAMISPIVTVGDPVPAAKNGAPVHAEPFAVTRWRGGQHSNLSLISQRMASEGLQPYRWKNGPHFRHAPRSYRCNKVVYCVQGLLTVIFPDIGQEITLYPGDRLDVARGIRYGQIVGAAGAECLESDRP